MGWAQRRPVGRQACRESNPSSGSRRRGVQGNRIYAKALRRAAAVLLRVVLTIVAAAYPFPPAAML
jgi:hypothetical protein